MWACSDDSPLKALRYEDGENTSSLALEMHPVCWRGPEILRYYYVHKSLRQGRQDMCQIRWRRVVLATTLHDSRTLHLVNGNGPLWLTTTWRRFSVYYLWHPVLGISTKPAEYSNCLRDGSKVLVPSLNSIQLQHRTSTFPTHDQPYMHLGSICEARILCQYCVDVATSRTLRESCVG